MNKVLWRKGPTVEGSRLQQGKFVWEKRASAEIASERVPEPEVRPYVTGLEPVQGGPDRPLYKAAKVESNLQWRLQDWIYQNCGTFAKDNWRFRIRTNSRRSFALCFIQQSWRLGRLNLLKALMFLSWVLDARHRSSTLLVWPTGFWSFFGSLFPYCVSILPFWSRTVLCHYTLRVCKLPFDFTGADSHEIALRIRHGGILPHGLRIKCGEHTHSTIATA